MPVFVLIIHFIRRKVERRIRRQIESYFERNWTVRWSNYFICWWNPHHRWCRFCRGSGWCEQYTETATSPWWIKVKSFSSFQFAPLDISRGSVFSFYFIFFPIFIQIHLFYFFNLLCIFFIIISIINFSLTFVYLLFLYPNFRCMGATTIEEYRKYIEKDTALARRFQVRSNLCQ